ncbi:class I SAM-dependent methyltransferase [Pelomonas sp. V22]|uniref:SAM-dependent methyltransferase n=1 Tax=Pelomonas sp. V22 TaxID=2822139 RepID=UPI0024A93A78|nr:cyclopropane-fatty-acyl-phospholipid synthase family protein [Pelomonas sp. V22]MDI4634109.1 class I SAM-dependent methyltransferase [Pelomonas sp. V22]
MSNTSIQSINEIAPEQRQARAPWLGRPLQAWAKRLLGRLLERLACGSLTVVLPDGSRLEGHGPHPGPSAQLQLARWRPLVRLFTQGDLGLARSYRDGDWSSPDLTALLELGIANDSSWGDSLAANSLVRRGLRLLHARNANTRKGSRRNIAAHYDLGNAFYAQWLDASMLYSSALYTPQAETLEAAQAAKLDRICELLDLKSLPPGARVLEIGCGWGALAVAMAQRSDVHVTALTLSKEQLAFAQQRVNEAGLADRIELRLQDYRDVQGQFDRIVSIEMIEAVGEAYWPVYFDTLNTRLKPGGHAVLQAITIDNEVFKQYRLTPDFIQAFIFPGGMLPSVEALHQQADRVGMRLASREAFGASYARTLADWRERFFAQWGEIEPLGFDEAFKRLWHYYLCYCEAGFNAGRVDVHLLDLRKA